MDIFTLSESVIRYANRLLYVLTCLSSVSVNTKGKSVTQPRINSFFILLNLYLHAYIKKKPFLFNHIFKTRTVAAKGNRTTRATFAR